MTAKPPYLESLEELAAAVCGALERAGFTAVLTGGAVVSIYSENEYASFDLDIISNASRAALDRTMNDLGFSRGAGRHYEHPDSQLMVEFPRGPVQIGQKTPKRFARRQTTQGVLCLLTPSDAIKDRLASYIHWNDPQALEQAAAIARRQPFNAQAVRRFCRQEGRAAAFDHFNNRISREN